MPAVSEAQRRMMAMVAHDKGAAKRLGIPQSVGKEFEHGPKDLPEHVSHMAKGGVAFDWNAHPDAPAAFNWDEHPDVAPEGPSGLESFGRGALQGGTLKFADEIAGGTEALWDKLTGSNTPFAEAYKKHRDESRASFEAAQKANPTEFGAGELAGNVGAGLAAAPLTGGASLGSAVALGGGLGAASALGGSNELDAQAAQEALKEGALGAITGGVGHGAGALIGKGVNAATKSLSPKVAEALDKLAISQGRRALNGGLKANLDEDAVRQALEEGAIRLGGTTQGAAERLAPLTSEAGAYKDALVKKFESLGVQGPDAQAMAENWIAEAAATKRATLGSSAPGAYERNAEELLGKAGESGNIPLSVSENVKTSAQAKANYNPFSPDTELNDAYKQMAKDLRVANEDRIAQAAAAQPENAELQEAARAFGPAKERYGNLVEALSAAEKGGHAAANRAPVGLTAKIIALEGLATGHPGGVATGVGKHLYDTRGASTISRAAYDASKSLGKLGHIVLTDPAKLGHYGSVLTAAYQRGGPDALNSAHFVLGQSDPTYQKMVADLDGAP